MTPTPDANPNPKVLVVDDEDTMRDVLELRLRKWGFDVVMTGDAREVGELVRSQDPDLVISDVLMPGMTGLELLRQLKGADPDRPVILLTAHGTVEMAVEAMKFGAKDFLTKPVNYPNLRAVIAEALQARGGKERAPQRAPVPSADGRSSFIGKSAAMREIYALIDSLAQRDVSVLITGESGTGKEMAARAIHERGVRKDGPFVALNSAAIPRDLVESELFGHTEGAFTGATRARSGCFELADGGTLFLDEITEMPIELQPKLLRVLDEATFRRVGGKREISANVRTLAATNADPRAAVRKGTLREDLYYRLNVVTLHLPPLRDRAEDIPVLATHFLERFQGKHHAPGGAIHDETMALLARYAWPGNVRELRNIMERAVILATGEWVEPTHLPAYIRQPGSDPTEELAIPTGMTAADVERRLILQTLEATGNNKAEAARILGLNVKTIRNKIRQYEGGS